MLKGLNLVPFGSDPFVFGRGQTPLKYPSRVSIRDPVEEYGLVIIVQLRIPTAIPRQLYRLRIYFGVPRA